MRSRSSTGTGRRRLLRLAAALAAVAVAILATSALRDRPALAPAPGPTTVVGRADLSSSSAGGALESGTVVGRSVIPTTTLRSMVSRVGSSEGTTLQAEARTESTQVRTMLVRGRVVDAAGAPVGAARVRMHQPDRGDDVPVHEVTTDVEGRFEHTYAIEKPLYGTIHIGAAFGGEAPHGLRGEVYFHLPDVLVSDVLDVGEVVARRLAHVRAIVRSRGVDPSGAELSFTWYDPAARGQNYVRGEQRVEVDASGTADVLIEDQDLCVCVWKSGWATQSRHVDTRDGEGQVTLDLAPEAVVHGRVVGPEGEGIARASLEAFASDRSVSVGEVSGRTTTDESGAFTLPGLGAGESYSVQVSNTGDYRPDRFHITPPDEGLVLTVARGGVIDVAAFAEAPFARSLSDSFVTYTRDERTGRWTRRCDYGGYVTQEGEDGPTFARTRMSALEPGTFRVLARVSGYARAASPPFEVEPGRTSLIRIRVEPGRTVVGRVVDAQKAPIASAAVRLDFDGLPVETNCAEDGRFTLEDLPAGAVGIEVHATGFQAVRLQVDSGRTDLDDVMLVP